MWATVPKILGYFLDLTSAINTRRMEFAVLRSVSSTINFTLFSVNFEIVTVGWFAYGMIGVKLNLMYAYNVVKYTR